MTKSPHEKLSRAAERLLLGIAAPASPRPGGSTRADQDAVENLLRADLIVRDAGGGLVLTSSGMAYLARRRIALGATGIDPFLGQHLDLARGEVETPVGRVEVTIDEAESPLVWLARRKGRDGRPLIETTQLQAGQRLRLQFTRANLMPKTTSSWSGTAGRKAGSGGGAAAITDIIVAARQQVQHALDAVGPEFSGLLVDVCCFLKGLEDVERDRGWPARSAKVVLQLALDRLARHYGLTVEARGLSRAPMRAWSSS
jgi:hypothetical protein